MRTIILLRHGKSDWDAEHDEDRDRPLARRGRRASALMGRFLAHLGDVPDLVLSSTAVRASDTARRAVDAGGWKCRVVLDDALYGTTPQALLRRVRRIDDAHSGVVLVGHEPVWSVFAGKLLGDAALRFPTAAMARVDLDVTAWSEARFGAGTLIWLVTPKLLAPLGKPREIS